MAEIPSFEEEVEKFRRMNRPGSGAYRLAHAHRGGVAPTEESDSFDPEAVYRLIDASAEAELEKLRQCFLPSAQE